MKKYLFRPLLTLLTACLVLALAGACKKQCPDSYCDEPAKPAYYDVQGVILMALDASRDPARVLQSGGAVPTASLLLEVRPDVRVYSWQAAPRPAGGFFPAAYALTPAAPTFTETLDSLRVRSRFDYDARHLAGTPLNDLLLATDDVQRVALPLPDYLTQGNGRLTTQLNLRLSAAPAQAGPQQFEVRYRLRNGEVYTALTLALRLN